MFPFFENIVFWAFAIVVWVATYVVARRHVRKHAATAPKESFRNPTQRAMHWASLLLLLVPIGYVSATNEESFWPVLAVLCAQAVCMVLLRGIGIGYAKRAWLLIPVAALSVVVGAVVAVWQSDAPLSIEYAPWLLLGCTALAFAVSAVVSIYSFPIGFGERSR